MTHHLLETKLPKSKLELIRRALAIGVLALMFQGISSGLTATWAAGCAENPNFCVFSAGDELIVVEEQHTLRSAVESANAVGGAKTIGFADELFGITRTDGVITSSSANTNNPVVITLQSTLEIRSDLTIRAPYVNNAAQILKIARGTGMETGTALIAVNPTVNGEPASVGATAQVTIENVIIDSNANPNSGSDPRSTPGVAVQVDSTAIESTELTPDLVVKNSQIVNGVSESAGAAISTPGNVVVENSTLKNNSATGVGGAIAAGGTVTISGSTLNHNSAASDGGAIFALETVTVTNSTFEGNEAGERGGAIFALETVTVTNSTFQGNEAGENGGAIFAEGTVTVTNSTLEGNNAGASGGAIFADQVTLQSSGDEETVISGNYAELDGGGIFAGTVTIENSRMQLNAAGAVRAEGVDAGFESSGWGGDGGAIFATDTVTITNSTFETNTAFNQDFGDYGRGGAVRTSGDITVSHSTFTNNSADKYGAAVYAGGEITVSNSRFTSNTAGDSGGAIATHSGETITVTNSAFQSNVATGISGDLYAGGGAIKGGDGLFRMDGSTFSENISNLDGGAILHFGNIEVTDSVFEDNEARFIVYEDSVDNGRGGAIFAMSEDYTELVSIAIDSSSFLGNKSAGDGGAIRVIGRIEVSQSSFLENESSDDGGAIDIDALEDFSGDETVSRISSSYFRSNVASGGDGGAIDGSDYVLIIEESQFLYNFADDDGGAIWSGGLVRVLDSDFNENTAYDDGGAIYADSVQINQSLFLTNQATEDGGAINVRNNDNQDVLSAILNSEFNRNMSMSGQGNALYGNAWLLLNSFVNYRTRGGVSVIALETNFSSVSIGNSFVELNPEVAGDGFCTIDFDYSANNFASDFSCLGVEADPVKSRVVSSSVDPDGYLAFSDEIFNGETGLLAFYADSDLRDAFIDTARGGLEALHGRLPTEDEIAEYESIPERRYAAQLDCWYDGISGADYYACGQEVYAEYQVEEDLYLETFGDVTELNLILEDVNDLDGHQFIGQYLSVDQNYFDRAVLSTWTAGAFHTEPRPVVVSNSNTSISIRSVSRTESNSFSSLEDQKIRAEKAALADAERKAAKSLRVAEIEKRKALTAQMRAKIAQTQVRGEMLKLKKQWQNLMKNFIW